MHPWRPLIGLCVLAACASQAAVIYKWTDANGLVHYSDQSVPGAQRIVTGTNSSRGIAASAPAGPAVVNHPQVNAALGLGYNELSIAAPAPGATFFSEPVTVRVNLSPGLKSNHTLTLYLNGAPAENQPHDSLIYVLENLPRGTYSAVVTIKDQDTDESQSSAPLVFYVRQPSMLAPQHKKT
jgi:hypothetical protein